MTQKQKSEFGWSDETLEDSSSTEKVEPSVLIVEDTNETRFVFMEALQKSGFTTFEAENVSDALDILRVQEPQFLIMDLGLPEIGGFTLLHRTRMMSPATEIYVVSGYSKSAYIRAAYAMGAMQYFIKPVGPLQLARYVLATIQFRSAGVAQSTPCFLPAVLCTERSRQPCQITHLEPTGVQLTLEESFEGWNELHELSSEQLSHALKVTDRFFVKPVRILSSNPFRIRLEFFGVSGKTLNQLERLSAPDVSSSKVAKKSFIQRLATHLHLS